MRPQFARSLRRLIYSLGPVMPVLILLVVNGKRW
jgi:hypothetical protein